MNNDVCNIEITETATQSIPLIRITEIADGLIGAKIELNSMCTLKNIPNTFLSVADGVKDSLLIQNLRLGLYNLLQFYVYCLRKCVVKYILLDFVGMALLPIGWLK